MVVDFPFTELDVNDYLIRTFDHNIHDHELIWHRDKENRIIESIGETDWLIQFDNELPRKIEGRIFIPKYLYHRVIKGSDVLKIKFWKLDD